VFPWGLSLPGPIFTGRGALPRLDSEVSPGEYRVRSLIRLGRPYVRGNGCCGPKGCELQLSSILLRDALRASCFRLQLRQGTIGARVGHERLRTLKWPHSPTALYSYPIVFYGSWSPSTAV